MYKRGGTRPKPSEIEKKKTNKKTRNGYGNRKLSRPCQSLAKSTDSGGGMIWNQVVAVASCPKAVTTHITENYSRLIVTNPPNVPKNNLH